jgi:hypothetical protein
MNDKVDSHRSAGHDRFHQGGHLWRLGGHAVGRDLVCQPVTHSSGRRPRRSHHRPGTVAGATSAARRSQVGLVARRGPASLYRGADARAQGHGGEKHRGCGTRRRGTVSMGIGFHDA